MAQINAYLNFEGNTREAMNFYKDALGGELTLQTIGESPIASQMPPHAKDLIVHSMLVSDNIVIMGSDMVLDGLIKGNNVSLSLQCNSEEEINRLFSKLSAGGNVDHPVKEAFWGGIFGHFTDKYGINWLMNYNKDQQG